VWLLGCCYAAAKEVLSVVFCFVFRMLLCGWSGVAMQGGFFGKLTMELL